MRLMGLTNLPESEPQGLESEPSARQGSCAMELAAVLAVQVVTVSAVAGTNWANTSHGYERNSGVVGTPEGEARSDASVKAPAFPNLAGSRSRSNASI